MSRIPYPLPPRRPVRDCKKILYNPKKKRHKYLFVHGADYFPIKDSFDALVKVVIRRLCKKFKIKVCAISKSAAYLVYVKF